MPADALKCKECRPTYPLDARYVCERCFGPLEVAYTRAATRVPTSCSAASRPARRSSGATPTSCRSSARPRRALPTGCTPLVRADRLAERLGLRGGLDQERRREPDALVQGPRRLGRARARRRARLRRRSPARRPATSPTPSPPTPRRRPAVLRLHPRRPRGAEDPRHRRLRHATSSAVRGNYDDVNRLCTELAGERDAGPSSTSTCARTTPRAPRRSPTRPPSSSAGSSPTASSRRSPRARCSQDRARLRGVARRRPARGRAARH